MTSPTEHLDIIADSVQSLRDLKAGKIQDPDDTIRHRLSASITESALALGEMELTDFEEVKHYA